MIIRSISIRSKIQLTSLVIVLLLGVLALIYMDAAKESSEKRDLLQERSILQSEFFSLSNIFNRIVLDDNPGMTAACISQVHRVEQQFRIITGHEAVSNLTQIGEKKIVTLPTHCLTWRLSMILQCQLHGVHNLSRSVALT